MTEQLKLDHAGGTALCNLTASCLDIEQDALRSLDIIHAKELRHVSIKGKCNGSRYLHVRDADALKRIRTVGDEGLVLHLESSTFMTGLCIEGSVRHIDAAWTNHNGEQHTFLCDSEQLQTGPWQQVYLTDITNLEVLEHAKPDDLVIVNAGNYPYNELSLSSQATLLVLNPQGVSELKLKSENLVQVIGHDSHLTHVQLAAPRAEFYGSAGLKVIKPLAANTITPLKTLLIKNSESEQLSINLATETLNLVNCNTRQLQFLAAETLRIHSCSLIEQIDSDSHPFYHLSGMVSPTLLEHARFALNESVIHSQLQGISDPQNENLQRILAMVPMQMRGRDVGQGLLVLERAKAIGVSIETLWALRNELNHNHQQDKSAGLQRSYKVPVQWRWNLSGDGTDEAWRADFNLWADAYVAGIESATALCKPVGTSIFNHDSALWAATHCLKYQPDALPPGIWARLVRQMDKIWRRNHSGSKLDKAKPQFARFLRYAVKYALDYPKNQINEQQQNDDEGLTEFKQAVIQLVVGNYGIEGLEPVAAQLFLLDKGLTRTALLRKSKEPEPKAFRFLEERDETLRSRYLKLALGRVVEVVDD
ncbi:hypothetical protein ACR0ST_08795 [Aliidiomarina sp. Khilg15.8]